MPDIQAVFMAHKVTPKGLVIQGLSPQGAVVEIFVDRADAELFGWIDPEEENDDEQEGGEERV